MEGLKRSIKKLVADHILKQRLNHNSHLINYYNHQKKFHEGWNSLLKVGIVSELTLASVNVENEPKMLNNKQSHRLYHIIRGRISLVVINYEAAMAPK